MTLAEISEISQTLGSAGVVTSLIFVGVQIRIRFGRREGHQNRFFISRRKGMVGGESIRTADYAMIFCGTSGRS